MKSIQEFPEDELKNDLQESLNDAKNCLVALSLGIENYSGGSVRDRLETNLKIAGTIKEELSRREKEKKKGLI